ncbi:hypothetical protein TEA_017129 [Camellia sinensis var. sinensis]|uniref:Inositol-1-monophosphatase n=1 Tax=Camellia sinensis var. sinensis TaxID=542762 RepID=A0A4S4E754_CAMSN|nr:hypothetical protein TEA_017129 [Camellia sinensis var. sinensis]
MNDVLTRQLAIWLQKSVGYWEELRPSPCKPCLQGYGQRCRSVQTDPTVGVQRLSKAVEGDAKVGVACRDRNTAAEVDREVVHNAVVADRVVHDGDVEKTSNREDDDVAAAMGCINLVAEAAAVADHKDPVVVDVDSHSQFLAIAVEAAKIAGDVDLVTETDKACEDHIFNHLKEHFPHHKFIGEETTAACGVTELTDEPTWIVDPLDGTTNFVHGFPFVCVSIGLTIGKVPTVGVVYNPIMDELFTGVHRKGAFLNGNPIKVSSQSELVKSLLVTEVRSLRMCGSCALDLCGVACGRIDLFYELGFGGPCSGKEFDITAQRVAASNPLLKDKFVEALRQSE